ncbi:hypothetical protein DXG03_003885 [Asterophora parasitica]|uniref:Pheromone receptor n=1 Tax=Asterophora parasitica TaxID=117018 RepID=A0A9P7KD80_9AGAR|nr:hypothetical protein DXG03_003885 [Asterophora parasitica]
MIIHYIVQGHRFDIFEDYGCMPFSYNTPITYVIVHGPIMALGIASAVYATLNVIRLNHRTDELRLLISSNASLNLNRYLRPIFLACIVIVLSVSLCVLDMTISALGDVKPYISWEHVHSDFSRIDQYPADVWRGTPTSNFQLEQARWGTLAYGLVFFALFGFAREARERYVHGEDHGITRPAQVQIYYRFQEEDGRRTDDSTAFSTFVLGDACSEISTIHFHEIEELLPIISNTSATPQQQVQKPNPGQAISIPSATESSITAAVSVSASPPYRAAPQAQLPTSATTSSESMYSTSTGPDPGPGESTPIPIPPFSRQAQAQTPRSHTGRDLQIATAPPRLIPRLPAPPPAGRTPGTSLRPRIQDRAPPAGPRRVVASTTHNSFLDLSDSPPSTPPVTLTRPQ